jgi:hypothetical protein
MTLHCFACFEFWTGEPRNTSCSIQTEENEFSQGTQREAASSLTLTRAEDTITCWPWLRPRGLAVLNF